MLAAEVARRAESDAGFRQLLEADPVSTLKTLSALETDVWVYRGVVFALGLVAAGGLALVAAIVLVESTNSVPTLFTAAISAAIGALAGLLAPSAH
jgi:hypothetical protein